MDANKPVIIRDSRGLLFYSTEAMLPDVLRFNLPANFHLFVEAGNFRKRNTPVNFELFKLAKPERKKKENPRNFRIVFNKNPSQVTVDWGMKTIFFDRSFLEKTIPEIYWALFHECGHRYWDKGEQQEENCDEYAVNCLLKLGFNPSQICHAVMSALKKDESITRKSNIVTKMMLKNGR